MRDDDAWRVGDSTVEWTGRADGIEDAQFSFSDMEPVLKAQEERLRAARAAEAKAKERL